MPAYGFKIEVIFIFCARAISLPGQCRYWLCTLALLFRACAHWPNVAQIDLTVVVVIVGVVVAVIVDMLRRYCCFSKSVTHRQTDRHTNTWEWL